MKKNRRLNVMESNIDVFEDIVLEYVIEYLNKNRYIELEILIPFIKSRITKEKLNLNEEGISKILKSLFRQNLIAEGSKLTKDEVLKNPPIRIKIYNYIKENPGIYYSKIIKQFKLGNHSATWHLEMLVRFDLIKEMKIEKNRVYYESSFDKKDIEKAYYLSNEKIISIIEYFDTNSTKGHNISKISKNLDMHFNTIKKYLNKLEELNIIQKRTISNKTLFFKN